MQNSIPAKANGLKHLDEMLVWLPLHFLQFQCHLYALVPGWRLSNINTQDTAQDGVSSSFSFTIHFFFSSSFFPLYYTISLLQPEEIVTPIFFQALDIAQPKKLKLKKVD